MDNYSKKDLEEALAVIASTIENCMKMLPKFPVGTSQHTLLMNRIKALSISQSLVAGEPQPDGYTEEELIEALRPLSSIISKCEKARQKLPQDTGHYQRYQRLITAMTISIALLTDEIRSRG